MATGALLLLAGTVPYVWTAVAHPQLMLVMVLAALPAFIVARVNDMAQKKDQDQAYLYQMGTLMFRMLFSLIVLGAFLYLQEQTYEQKLVAIGWFFLAYVTYAAVEVKAFLANLRRH